MRDRNTYFYWVSRQSYRGSAFKMKIGNPTTAMTITILYRPEMRFTAGGRALCIIEAEGIIGMRFEAWEDLAEAIADADLKAGDAVEVKGDAWVRGWQDKDGEHHQMQVFTVREWQRVNHND